MPLFDMILGAINNPTQQGSSSQLADVVSTVQQLSNQSNASPSAIQSIVSIVGSHARSALQQRRATMGNEQTQSFVNQYSGTHPSTQAVQLLFNAPHIQQIVQEAEQRTGLNAGTIQAMLPILVPLVLKLLQTGTSNQNPQSSNSVLSSFLDANGDGEVDIADALMMAGRYIGR